MVSSKSYTLEYSYKLFSDPTLKILWKYPSFNFRTNKVLLCDKNNA